MHKSRLILLCIIVFVLAGARTAKAQDGVASLDDQIQNKYSEREPDKTAATHQQNKTKARNNDGNRKHWWLLPHLHHKKKDENSASQLKAQPKRNPTIAHSQALKTSATQKRTARTSASQKNSAPKRMTAANPAHRTLAKSKSSSNPAGKTHKGTVASSGHAKDVRQNCSSAVAKKGACQSVQKHSSKADTRSS